MKQILKTPEAEQIRTQILGILGKKWKSLFEIEDIILRENKVIVSLFECF
jgi:hypothetical protein